MAFKDILVGDNLLARCLRACCWVGLSSIGSQAIRMVRMLVLTYILAPEDIGIVILVWYILGLLQELSDVGTKHAIIQNPRGLEDKYLDCAWMMNLVRCLGLGLVLFLAAPYIAKTIYGQEQLLKLLRLSCLILIFDGLTSMSLVTLRKQLTFGLISLATLTGHGVGTIIAILLAWKMRDAQGVVIGEICGAGTICLLSYLVHPYRPRLRWNGNAARELIGYGLMAYLVSLIDAFGMRLDILILARIAPLSEVGKYGPAMQIAMAPCAIFSLLTISVGFPALSMLQSDLTSVRRGTAQIIKASQVFTIPIFAALALLGPDIVRILPEKYAEVGQALRWLSLTGFLMVFLRQITPALYAIKQVYWFVIRGLIQITIILILLTPFYEKWGITGICWTINIAFIVTNIFVWLVALRVLHWPWRQWLADIAITIRALAAGIITIGLAYLILRICNLHWSDHLWIRLAVTMTGLAGYIFVYLKNYQRK
jgi:O-antigen/teichoic acid export membrane protein